MINAREVVENEWIILLNRNICRNPNHLLLRIRSACCEYVLVYPVYVNRGGLLEESRGPCRWSNACAVAAVSTVDHENA